MKKIISLLLSIIILICSLPLVCVSASTSADGLYEFEVIDNSYAEITNYLGSDDYVVIPSQISINSYISYPVKSIGESAFGGCESLKQVTIPYGITNIGKFAFEYCNSLTDIVISDSVTNLDEGAFYCCESLKSVTIGTGVKEIPSQAFIFCSNLESVTIPNSVTSIGGSAFYGCALTNVTIPASVTTIGEEAFRFCDLMTNLTISNGVKEIGLRAFYGCESLISIVVPESVEKIGYLAFAYCENLELVILPKTFKIVHTDDYDWASKELFYNDDKVSIHGYANSSAYDYAMYAKIPFFAHEFTEIVDYKEPTCTESGGNIIKCAHCSETISEIPALGHSFNKGDVIKKSTCSIEGILEQTCLRCGYKQKSTIPTKPHKWKYVVARKATCFKAGLGKFKCKVCKTFSEKTKRIPKIKLKKPKAKFVKVGNQLKVKYNKVNGANGFEIIFVIGTSIYREKAYLITSKKNKTCFKNITNMKNVYCYAEVRAYAKQGNKIKWSKPTKLKKIYL